MKWIYTILLLCLSPVVYAQHTQIYVQVLGVAQDGGYPHMGCSKQCCAMAWKNTAIKKHVVSLALIDPVNKKWWLFEATPDIKEQLHYFQTLTNGQYHYLPDGIFITHAHIGHYTGLMELGREVMNTKDIPVYVLPKMKAFLETNGPWSQLVSLHNITPTLLQSDQRPNENDVALRLADNLVIRSFLVPHRDEYSETAGFEIITDHTKYVFIPDIDKWSKLDRDIIEEVQSMDVALLDATFYDNTELPGRKISEVPHPFVSETMQLFKDEKQKTKSKIYFIHFNHTNPLLWDAQKQNEVKKAGFNIAKQGQEF